MTLLVFLSFTALLLAPLYLSPVVRFLRNLVRHVWEKLHCTVCLHSVPLSLVPIPRLSGYFGNYRYVRVRKSLTVYPSTYPKCRTKSVQICVQSPCTWAREFPPIITVAMQQCLHWIAQSGTCNLLLLYNLFCVETWNPVLPRISANESYSVDV